MSNNDFETITDYDNLYAAHKSCRKGKLWKDSVAAFDLQASVKIEKLRSQLLDGSYQISEYHCFTINERGKLRNIKSTRYRDRVVQKSLMDNVLTPKITPKLVYDNGASLAGKGTDFALKRLKQHMQRYYRKHGADGYILVCDFKGYFDSIRHDIVNSVYEKCVDDKTMELIRHIHDSIPGGVGVPLGNQLSQLDALLIANPIDHFIREKLCIGLSGRYMDDFYLIHESKEFLDICLDEIDAISKEIGLQLNMKKTHITTLKAGINFLGFHHRLTDTGKVVSRVKAKSKNNRRRKMRKHKALVDAGKMTYEAAKQSYESWKAHAGRLKRGNGKSKKKKYGSYYLICEMDCYFYSLFINYLSPEERAKYERLKIGRHIRKEKRNV